MPNQTYESSALLKKERNRIRDRHLPEKRNLKDDENKINERSSGRNDVCPFL